MKAIIAFAVAFIIGTAAGTGTKVLFAKPAPAANDSTHAHADSTRHDSGSVAAAVGQPSAQTGAAPAAAADSTKNGATAAAIPAVNIKPPLPNQAAIAAAAAAASPANDTATQSAERRIAKVFTSMDAKQAAKVLEHMSDGDVHVILGYVGPRQAASILAELPPERVATLSKLAMQKAGAK